MIEKRIVSPLQIGGLFDSPSKVAFAQFETHIPDDIVAYLDKIRGQADPRFTYVHIIAMTNGHRYGANLNGDVFTEQDLLGIQGPDEAAKNPGDARGVALPRYKTFEQSKFFRNHANSETDPYYGDIPCAAWNIPLHRVELIVRIAKAPVPELGMRGGEDICRKLAKRGYLTGSMGTRIKYEKCSACGHENELLTDRCVHLRNQMNEILPDGRQVYAENFGTRFFDYSDVDIPADPTAISLAKVASAKASSVNQAHDVHDSAWRAKLSEIEKEVPSSGSAACLPACEVESHAAPDEYSDQELKAAAAYGFNTALSTAAIAGIVFSPRELIALAMPYSKSASLEYAPVPRITLDNFHPGVYNVLRAKVATRSGFVAPLFAAEWDPGKIAAQGFQDAADYYRLYRRVLGSCRVDSITKAARAPALRDLVVNRSPLDAARYLAYSGLGA